MAELSPMMQQYMDIKKQYKDEILFYRIGDFYEMFFDDALTASRELDLTLTGKQCGMEERAPMCGVPFHSYEGYVARLIAKGYKDALAEGQSQLFIEAPYRNVKLMEQLVQTLGDQTRLTVAVDLTAPDERIETHTAGEWRRRQLPEMNRRPAIFIIG